MRAECPNLGVALTFCATGTEHAEAGVRLAGALYYFWYGCGETHGAASSVELLSFVAAAARDYRTAARLLGDPPTGAGARSAGLRSPPDNIAASMTSTWPPPTRHWATPRSTRNSVVVPSSPSTRRSLMRWAAAGQPARSHRPAGTTARG
jgi:hypothetical protein